MNIQYFLFFLATFYHAALFCAHEKTGQKTATEAAEKLHDLSAQEQAVVAAIENKDKEALQKTLAALSEAPTFIVDRNGSTPLMKAIETRFFDIFEPIAYRLEETLSPKNFHEHLEITNRFGQNPLDLASDLYQSSQAQKEKDDLEDMMTFLIECGAVETRSSAIINKAREYAIKSVMPGVEEFYKEIINNNIEAIQKILQQSLYASLAFSIVSIGKNQGSPLTYAASKGNLALVNIIVSYLFDNLSTRFAGYYLNYKDLKERTALAVAAKKYHKLTNENDPGSKKRTIFRNIIRMLIEHGAKTEKQDQEKYSIISQELYMPSKEAALQEAEEAAKKEHAIIKQIPKRRTPEQAAQVRAQGVRFTPETKPDRGIGSKDYLNTLLKK